MNNNNMYNKYVQSSTVHWELEIILNKENIGLFNITSHTEERGLSSAHPMKITTGGHGGTDQKVHFIFTISRGKRVSKPPI